MSVCRCKVYADICGGSLDRDRGRQTRVWRTAIFSVFAGYFSETLEMIEASVIIRDMQSVVSFSVIPKCMTLNDPEWLFCVKLCFRAGLSGSNRATFEKMIVWKLMIDTYCQRRRSSAGSLIFGNIRFVRISLGFSRKETSSDSGPCCGRTLKFIRCVRNKFDGSSDVGFAGDRRKCTSLRR